MHRHHINNTGEFVEKDHGHTFTYRKTTDPWAIRHGFQHEVDVGYDTRFAKVVATRCYMVIDEDEYGKPVVEKWQIKNHRVYN